MRRPLALLILTLGLILMTSRPASAQGFWRWLEALSGPGPSHGVGVELPIWCRGFKVTSQQLEVFAQPGCSDLSPDRVRVTIGPAVSFLRGDNTLSYAPGTPADQIDRVRIDTYAAFVDVSVHRVVDVGFAAGLMRVSDLPVASFSKAILTPVRVGWRPLMHFGDPRPWKEILVLRYDATWIPGGVKDTDFGALPGTFSSPAGEIVGSYSVLVTFFPLAR